MADLIAGITSDGVARVLGGQSFTVLLQLTANGAVQDLTGRSFALSFRNKRLTTAIVDPAVLTAADGAQQLALTISASQTPAIIAALRSVAGVCELSEVFSGSIRPLQAWPVVTATGLDLSSIDPGEQDAPGTLIRYDVIAGTTEISQLGPMGWSAAQQVARVPGSGLTDTSDAAFTAWLILKATGVNLLDTFGVAPALAAEDIDGAEQLLVFKAGALHSITFDQLALALARYRTLNLASPTGAAIADAIGILG